MIFLTCLSIACSNNSKHAKSQDEDISVENPFSKYLNSSYEIEDSAAFITALKEHYDLKTYQDPATSDEEISYYGSVNIEGYEHRLYLIELKWNGGASASYPWKYQLILDTIGNNFGTFDALGWELIEINPHKAPLLLSVISTSKGNGGHRLYKIKNDSMENIYEGYYNYQFRTYDCHFDESFFKPCELKLGISDLNDDGYDDLRFYGTRIWLAKETPHGDYYDGENGVLFTIENPAKIDSVEYVFLYDTVSGHFREIE